MIGAQNGQTLSLIVTDRAGNSSLPSTLTVEPPLPPDPATVAPPLDRTVATTLIDSASFLFTGPTPIQIGVAAGTIEASAIRIAKQVLEFEPRKGLANKIKAPGIGYKLCP